MRKCFKCKEDIPDYFTENCYCPNCGTQQLGFVQVWEELKARVSTLEDEVKELKENSLRMDPKQLE